MRGKREEIVVNFTSIGFSTARDAADGALESRRETDLTDWTNKRNCAVISFSQIALRYAFEINFMATVAEISQPRGRFSFKLIHSRTGLDQGGVPVMKKVLLGGVALLTLGLVGSAVAADMPMKAPVVVSNTWTGWYVGIDAGGVRGLNSSQSFAQTPDPILNPAGIVFDPVTFTNQSHWGATGGVYGGYNWQLSSSWVVGAEVDWNKTSLGNTPGQFFLSSLGFGIPPCVGGVVGPGLCHGLTMSNNVNWTATARARIGYTFGSAMLYATGGGAWASEEFSGQVAAANFFTSTITTSSNHTSSGWVAGGGIEFMATANWLLRLEYLHYALNSGTTVTAPCSSCVFGVLAGPGTFTWGNSSLDVIRGGLSYKF
jgi:outer membrane immunogenic protein